MLRKHTEEALNRFAKNVIKHAKGNLTRQKKKVSKVLYDSLGHDVNVYPKSFFLEFEMSDYADFVDQGVSGTKRKFDTPYSFKYDKPSKKHVDSLVKWVNTKRMRLRDETGKFKKGGQRSLAYAIGYSTKRKGIAPSLFFTRPFEAAFKNLPDEIVEAYMLDVDDFIDYTFRNNGTTK